MRELGERSWRGLAAKRHGRAVETAERAVHPLAPPATARRLHEQAGLPFLAEGAALELIEEIAEVRIGKLVQFGDGRRSRRRSQACGPSDRSLRYHSGDTVQRFAPTDTRRQLREHLVGLARDHGVDKRELAHGLDAHCRLAVGSPHHDEGVRQPCLHALRERERCEVLLEDAREADEARLGLDDTVSAPVDELARGIPRSEDRADFARRWPPRRVPAEPRRRLEQHAGDVALVVVRVPVVQRVREDPLADKRARHGAVLARDLRVQLLANPLTEGEREVQGPARQIARGDLRLQQAEAQRGRQQRTERHRNEEDVDRRGHRVDAGVAAGSAAASRSAAASSGYLGPAFRSIVRKSA